MKTHEEKVADIAELLTALVKCSPELLHEAAVQVHTTLVIKALATLDGKTHRQAVLAGALRLVFGNAYIQERDHDGN